MGIKGENIASIIKSQIENFEYQTELVDIGTVVEVGDGVARIHGLSGVGANELVEFEGGISGIALNLEENVVGAVILGDPLAIKEGTEVRGLGRVAEIPVGEKFIGRVVDGLANPIDNKGTIESTQTRPTEVVAPDVASRQEVNVPLQTGIKAIDSMIPIGRGQRELIIGDRSTGKTSIGIDSIINQAAENVICIYVSIGQKVGKVAQTYGILEQNGAMEHTIIVAANASDPAPMQFLAPYTGCALGEFFMHQGKDVLIVYDDLSKHSWAYRQMSLILKRPPGREAYPGDVFYLHSRLLERAARLSKELGGGSLTALPIIETLAGDVSAYIPTNVISITDGQIYLEPELFNSGSRPAINAGLSVSRVGSTAQTKAMKTVAGRLRLDLAQYRELSTFAQFGTEDLDQSTKSQLERGSKAVEVLKQNHSSPLSIEKQIVILFALTNGYIDDIETNKVLDFETKLYEYMEIHHQDLMNTISAQKTIDDETSSKLSNSITEFKKSIA
tara:strand:- start:3069 stop:4577 length:1509 start_codon:yes stop_codon:yes gene_type:complete